MITRFHIIAFNYIHFSSSQARPLLIRAIEEENVDSFIDPRLQNEFDRNQSHMTFNQKKIQMTRMVACAAACTRHSAIYIDQR
jgi:uncharacterized protein (DUF1800 family)